jgi:acyl-CoA dehydrogenase
MDDATHHNRTADWKSAAEAAAVRIALTTARHDEDDSFVADGFDLLKREGFFKAHVPTELGGGGASYSDICDVVRTLGRACGSTALAFAMHTHLVAAAVWRWRNQGAPTEGLLRRVAAEDLVLVSSGGSDWLDSAGTAVRTDGGFRVTARKVFSSGSPAGDLLLTSVVYDDPQAGPTVLHFAISLKAGGVTIQDTWRVLGMRGSGSHDVELTDVFVPDDAVSGRRPQGKWHPLFHAISLVAFPIIYSSYLGVAEFARNRALEVARRKTADEALIALTGEMENAFASAELAVRAMVGNAETSAAGPQGTHRAMIGRTLAGQAAIRTVEKAMEVAGGAAFYRTLGLERAFRDVQGARYHPLQEKAQLRYAGRFALGLDIDG